MTEPNYVAPDEIAQRTLDAFRADPATNQEQAEAVEALLIAYRDRCEQVEGVRELMGRAQRGGYGDVLIDDLAEYVGRPE